MRRRLREHQKIVTISPDEIARNPGTIEYDGITRYLSHEGEIDRQAEREGAARATLPRDDADGVEAKVRPQTAKPTIDRKSGMSNLI